MRAQFEIKSPPSLNEQRRWSIGKTKRFRDDLAFEMIGALRKSGVFVKASDRLMLATNPVKRVVKFTRFFGGKVKELDQDDNLPGACKPVLDELKLVTWRHRVHGQLVERPGLGLIFDDRREWCQALYDQEKKPTKAGQLLVEVS